MKRIFILAAALSALAACGPKERTMNFPAVEAATSANLIIEKVELTDSLTKLHIRGYNNPGWWLNIVPETHLVADGKKYEMVGTEGIEPNVYLWMPEDGDSLFVLKFEPLPLGTRKFDFIEGEVEGAFKQFGIDLTGKPATAYRKGLPKNIKSTSETVTEVPGFVYDIGETTINLHLLGYVPGYGDKVFVYINDMFGRQSEHIVRIDQATGTGVIKFRQYGSSEGFIVNSYQNASIGDFRIAPGETVDIWCDLAYVNCLMTHMNRTEKPEMEIIPLYSEGSVYDDLNNLPPDSELEDIGIEHMYYAELEDYELSADAYTDKIIKEYEDACRMLELSQGHPLAKNYKAALLMGQALTAMGYADYNRMNAFREANNIPYDAKCEYYPEKVTEEHIRRVGDMFNFKDPVFMMCAAGSVTSVNPKMDEGEKYGNTIYLKEAYRIAEEAQNGRLSEEDREMMKQWEEPFFALMCEDIFKHAVAKIESGMDNVQTTPDVPLENLFEAIIAPHKGKVVLVDFWNTWCGPCRSAINHNEPYKTGELNNENLVWIYIANETSPLNKYLEMIPDIKGLHYRMTPEQWKQLTRKDFDIDGIPSYVFVKKDGSYSLSNEFRDHKLMVERLKDELGI